MMLLENEAEGRIVNDSSESETLYAELKRLIESKGLLKRQPLYYAIKIPATLAMMAIGLAVMVWTDNPWIRIVDAIFLGFAATQCAFIGHDAGHRQIFRSTWKNDIIGLINNFLVGGSFFWWMDTHNKHHSKPNQVSYDPAIDYSIIAFSEEDALGKSGIGRFIVKYQTFLFVPLMFLYPISMRIDSLRFLVQSRSKYRYVEAALMAAHFVCYFWLVFAVLDAWQAVLFIMIHQSLFGLYLASVFVPNHIGMVILEEDSDLDFLTQQVITARNIKGGRLTDFWYGGLNLQIEHHLFPKMARNQLRKAKRIVEDFCREKSVTYHEVGFLQTYREIFSDLNRVVTVLRKEKAA